MRSSPKSLKRYFKHSGPAFLSVSRCVMKHTPLVCISACCELMAACWCCRCVQLNQIMDYKLLPCDTCELYGKHETLHFGLPCVIFFSVHFISTVCVCFIKGVSYESVNIFHPAYCTELWSDLMCVLSVHTRCKGCASLETHCHTHYFLTCSMPRPCLHQTSCPFFLHAKHTLTHSLRDSTAQAHVLTDVPYLYSCYHELCTYAQCCVAHICIQTSDINTDSKTIQKLYSTKLA